MIRVNTFLLLYFAIYFIISLSYLNFSDIPKSSFLHSINLTFSLICLCINVMELKCKNLNYLNQNLENKFKQLIPTINHKYAGIDKITLFLKKQNSPSSLFLLLEIANFLIGLIGFICVGLLRRPVFYCARLGCPIQILLYQHHL